MSSDIDPDTPGSGLDRNELLDELRRTMEAAGMDVRADVRELPARWRTCAGRRRRGRRGGIPGPRSPGP